eukprot:TRINITY_DN23821_c0_g1_i2.p1 TRINITY_DN23821_c0_g1~~TRINITY_DN23821_c0_g1_i2.p1  ORF type:complete len:146 (+),score=21.65 TRINITY_DN23821_c0_g1_i2:94-531(+)
MAMNGAPLLQGKPALAGDVSSRGGCFMSLEGWRDEALLRWQHMPSMKKPVFEQEYPRPWSTCLRLILFVVVSVATLVLSGGIYLPREVDSFRRINRANLGCRVTSGRDAGLCGSSDHFHPAGAHLPRSELLWGQRRWQGRSWHSC